MPSHLSRPSRPALVGSPPDAGGGRPGPGRRPGDGLAPPGAGEALGHPGPGELAGRLPAPPRGGDRPGRDPDGDRGQGRGMGLELEGLRPLRAALVVADHLRPDRALGRLRGDHVGRRGAAVPRARGPAGLDRRRPGGPRRGGAAGRLGHARTRADPDPEPRPGRLGLRPAPPRASARLVWRLQSPARPPDRRASPGLGDVPRRRAAGPRAPPGAAEDDPGRPPPRPPATRPSSSRAPTACTSTRTPSAAARPTASPRSPSATPPRCGCDSGT